MSIQAIIEQVLGGYLDATSEKFAEHSMANTVRSRLPAAIESAFPQKSGLLKFKGSAGQSQWVRAPWAAVYNRLITDSAQRGFYPVYLFSEDMSGVYLSLNQAMTEAKKDYRVKAKTALRARAGNFRALLGSKIAPFSTEDIDLSPSSPSNDSAFYEAGNICSVFYPASSVPNDEIILSHWMRVMELYDRLIESDTSGSADESDDKSFFFEGGKEGRLHRRVERNRRLIKQVKKKKGCRCEACKVTFKEVYGELGEDYIEAHHLVPFADLKASAVALDPVKDFAVLCSNCHRMIHRMNDPSDVEALRALLT